MLITTAFKINQNQKTCVCEQHFVPECNLVMNDSAERMIQLTLRKNLPSLVTVAMFNKMPLSHYTSCSYTVKKEN